jgi:GT2 family glycosyltransferase
MKHKADDLVSVIIVTKGVGGYLPGCLRSVRAQTYRFIEVIVIDNSLDEGFTRDICRNFPWARIYPSVDNLFYARSLNKGIGLSRGEFILCLNDDVCLDKEFIKEAFRGFSKGADIGMIGGKILRGDKKTLDSTGLYLSVFRSAGERGYGTLDTGRFRQEGRIFGPSGAVAFYRKEMLEDVKEADEYFDTDLVMFYEDLDLAWRANRHRWQGWYMPKALAFHARGGSFRPDSGLGKPLARRYLNDKLHAGLIRNRYLVMIKNERILNLIAHIIPVLLYDMCAWLYVCIFHPKIISFFLRDTRSLRNAMRKRKACL